MVHGTHNALPDPRNESIFIYVNGELLLRNEAKISVFDSGFLVGDGVWEAFRLIDGVLVDVDKHFDRLFQGAKAIGLDIGKTRNELLNIVRLTLHKNHMQTDVHVRLMITRGIKIAPSQDPRLAVIGPSIVIIPEYKKPDPESKNRGIKLLHQPFGEVRRTILIRD